MTPDQVRLHITPFNPDLLKAVVGAQLLGSVSNLSYHTIQTFPESNYGFLDLPKMEGEKLKKRLNGAILKGKKIKVEEAQPAKRRRIEDEGEDAKEKSKSTKTKNVKKEPNVLAGHELSPGRKVKRGWTEAKSSKTSKKSKGETRSSSSKYTDKDELLFRTNIPPNKLDTIPTGKAQKSKSKRKNMGEQVVHEFEKATVQPSFLKQDVGLGIKTNLQYVEDQGWVDDAGQVVEQESMAVRRHREVTKTRAQSKKSLPKQPASDDGSGSVSSSASTSEDEDNDEIEQNDETSSSGSSMTSDESASSTPMSNTPEPAEGPGVHPLEALFKKPNKPASQDIAKPSLELSTSFSFFEAGDADDLEEEPNVPLTPFSSQDVRSRGLRSAAPTPDTAHPSRFNSYGSSGLPGDEDLDEDEPPPAERASTKKGDKTPARTQSEFEKKFWEHRAENNRAWKLRRRTVLKEKRQRENKARRPKNW